LPKKIDNESSRRRNGKTGEFPYVRKKNPDICGNQ
jgi:hypothetical protein